MRLYRTLSAISTMLAIAPFLAAAHAAPTAATPMDNTHPQANLPPHGSGSSMGIMSIILKHPDRIQGSIHTINTLLNYDPHDDAPHASIVPIMNTYNNSSMTLHVKDVLHDTDTDRVTTEKTLLLVPFDTTHIQHRSAIHRFLQGDASPEPLPFYVGYMNTAIIEGDAQGTHPAKAKYMDGMITIARTEIYHDQLMLHLIAYREEMVGLEHYSSINPITNIDMPITLTYAINIRLPYPVAPQQYATYTMHTIDIHAREHIFTYTLTAPTHP